MSATTFTADRLDALADAPHALDLTVPELRELVRFYRDHQDCICPEAYALTLQAVASETKAKLVAEEKLRELSKGSPRPEAHTTQGMSEAEVLAVLDDEIWGAEQEHIWAAEQDPRKLATRLRTARSAIESLYADRSELIAMVERLIAVAAGFNAVDTVRDAEALLTRIAQSGAKE